MRGDFTIYKRALFVLLFLSTALISCGDEADTLSAGNWRILYQQDESLASVLKAESWKPVSIPLMIKPPYSTVDEFSFVWLRGIFNIKGDPAEFYGLSTGRIRFSDEIYINGKLIGRRPLHKIDWNPSPRNYRLPGGVLKKGENTVYIRLGIYSRYEGGMLSDVILHDEVSFEHNRFFSELIYRYLPFMMLFIFSGFSAALLIVYFLNRNEKLPLYTVMGLLVYILYMLTLLPQNRMASYETYLAVLMSIIPLFSISVALFIQSIYRIFLNNYNRIFITTLLVFTGIIIMFKDSEYNIEAGFWITNISLAISIPYAGFLIYRLSSINPDKFLRNTMIIMSVMVVFIIVFEFYSEYTGRYYSDLVAKSSPLAFLVLFAVIFHREILRRQMELEFLYKKLRRFEGYDRELSITDLSEEKLKRVEDFINENFTEDISREGLASAVEMNPNYMGSLFKTYTGKTINEYINTLRVEEAKRLLDEGRLRVIDIAFEVGFENIVTFNRVFKKLTGRTPSEYKSG